MLTLEGFIKNTLGDIVKAVRAIDADPELGGVTALPLISTLPANAAEALGLVRLDLMRKSDGTGNVDEYASVIEFDVAVTAEDTATKGKEGGVRISVLSAGGSTETETKNSSVSRIKFKIPLHIQKPEALEPYRSPGATRARRVVDRSGY